MRKSRKKTERISIEGSLGSKILISRQSIPIYRLLEAGNCRCPVNLRTAGLRDR